MIDVREGVAAPARGVSGRTVRWLLAGGLVAGALDITYAIGMSAFRGRTPIWLLQTVASGLLGKAAFDGGVATGALGLLLHFLIALGWCAVYYATSRKVGLLARRPLLVGPIFGVIIYLTMNFVVIPLSAFPLKVTYAPSVVVTGLLVHMFLIGVPIALAVRKARFSSE